MAWCRPGNKPLSEPMMISLPMHICVTRPQWVNTWPDILFWRNNLTLYVWCEILWRNIVLKKHKHVSLSTLCRNMIAKRVRHPYWWSSFGVLNCMVLIYLVKWLQPFLRLSTCRFHPQLPDLQICYTDLTRWRFQDSNATDGHQAKCPFTTPIQIWILYCINQYSVFPSHSPLSHLNTTAFLFTVLIACSTSRPPRSKLGRFTTCLKSVRRLTVAEYNDGMPSGLPFSIMERNQTLKFVKSMA